MKKSSLSAALKEVTRPPDIPSAAPRSTAPRRKQDPPPSREGKKAITGFFDPATSKQLRQIGLELDRTVQDLVREALNDLFQKYGRPPIA